MKKVTLFALFLFLIASHSEAYRLSGPKWSGTNPVVNYYFNEVGTPDVTNEFDFMHESFKAWTETPGTVIAAKYMGTTATKAVFPDKINILKWEEGADFPFSSQVIAVCYTWFGGSAAPGAQMYYSNFDIVFNGRDFSWSTTGEKGKMDVGHIATHEIGHALGIAHSENNLAVMWPYASSGDTRHRHLKTDDSLAITNLYPRNNVNNSPPVITSKPVLEAIAGEKYTYDVIAEDKDGDTLRYSLLTMPLNMKIDSVTGLIVWYPKFLDIGSHDVTVQAKDKMGATAKQTYKLNASDLVVSTNNDTFETGDTVLYPVQVTQMDEYGIMAGNIELRFNKKEITVLGTDTAGSVLSGITLFSNLSSDTLKVAFAGSKPVSGKGVLFKIKLVIAPEQCGKMVSMHIVKAFFNDGDPVANKKDGMIFAPCGPDGGNVITGSVVCAGSGKGVSGVALALIETKMSDTSAEDGSYSFRSVPRSLVPYSITAVKDSGDTRDAVSAYDASLILRSIVGLATLGTFKNQKDCADVNVNGMITAYDAALILRFVVGLKDDTKIGKWVLAPDKIVIPQLTTDIQSTPFTAYMIGDVSGNWGNKGMPKGRVAAASLVLNTFEEKKILIGKVTTKVYRATISVENAAQQTFAGEFEIKLNGDRVKIHAIQASAMLDGFLTESNVAGTSIRFAFAGTSPLPASGTLATIDIIPTVTMAANDTALTNISLKHTKLNEMPVQARSASNSTATVLSVNAPKVLTSITDPSGKFLVRFSVGKPQNIRITVFDLHGRELTKLLDKTYATGAYTFTWNERDLCNRPLGSKVYFLRITCDDFSKTLKLNRMR